MIFNPLEQFEVYPLLNFLTLSITNHALYCIIIISLIILFHNFYQVKIIGNKWSISTELLISSISKTNKEQTGNIDYLPFIYSIFIIILFSNLVGNLPYSYAITSSIIVCIGLSIIIFIGVTILIISKHKLHFFSFFVPAGTPLGLVPLLVLIELISYFSRSISLGLRLAANIIAGHTLLHILSIFLLNLFKISMFIATLTLIPFFLYLSLIGLELAISFIQAYVLTILVSSYIKDALELH